jgi:hypothetical protein
MSLAMFPQRGCVSIPYLAELFNRLDQIEATKEPKE